MGEEFKLWQQECVGTQPPNSAGHTVKATRLITHHDVTPSRLNTGVYFFRMMLRASTARSRSTGQGYPLKCDAWSLENESDHAETSLLWPHFQVDLLGRRLRAGLLHHGPQQLPHHPAAIPTCPTHTPLWKHTRHTGQCASVSKTPEWSWFSPLHFY